MSINSLYFSDLTAILYYVVEPNVIYTKDWKQNLPLMGVCRLWTHIVHPFVYQTALFEQKCAKVEGKSTIECWDTNIDCIAIRRCWSAIQIVDIRFHDEASGRMPTEMLDELLCMNEVDWSGVRSLSIDCMLLEDSNMSDYDYLDREDEEFGYRLVKSMPGVNSLNLYCKDSSCSYIFSSLILDAYILQLRSLNTYPAIPLYLDQTPYFGSALTNLSVFIESDILQMIGLPVVFANSLLHLYLENVPCDFSWLPFSNAPETNHIHFKNLITLDVKYSAVVKAEKFQNANLHFPKLKRLHISNPPANCSVQSADFGPQKLKSVCISGNWKDISESKDLWLKTHMLVIKPMGVLNSSKSIQMTNKIFEIKRNSDRRKLSVRLSNTIGTGLAKWSYLDELELDNVDVETLLKLLLCLPRLSTLMVWMFSFGKETPTTELVNNLFLQYFDGAAANINITELYINKDNKTIYSTEGLPDEVNMRIIYNFIFYLEILQVLKVPKNLGQSTLNMLINHDGSLTRASQIRLI